MTPINRENVGRIAERIVANEFEFRGFRVSDLNKEGLSANADLLAVKDGKAWQVQVKGASSDGTWWVSYGFASQEKIDKQKPMFNSADSYYKADVVVLVWVESPSSYKCVVSPEVLAEALAQLCVDYSYRMLNRDGSVKKPGKTSVSLHYLAKSPNADRLKMMEAEQSLLEAYIDKWHILEGDLGGEEIMKHVETAKAARLR